MTALSKQTNLPAQSQLNTKRCCGIVLDVAKQLRFGIVIFFKGVLMDLGHDTNLNSFF